jgi:pre-mRNA-processing factor 17
MYNPPLEELEQAVQGPVNPFARPMDNMKNTPTGSIAYRKTSNLTAGVAESHVMAESDFEAQRRTFIQYGYAVDPATAASGLPLYYGNAKAAMDFGGATVNEKLTKTQKERFRQRKRLAKGDPGNPDSYLGPWAGYVGENVLVEQEVPDEDEMIAAHQVRVEAAKQVPTIAEVHGNEKSVFHGDQEFDYLGRSYVHIPRDLDIDLTRDPGNHECFAPKKRIHTWYVHCHFS